VEVPAEGFAVALPDAWVVADLTAEDLDMILDELEDQNPQMGSIGEQARNLATQGVKLFAADPETTTEGLSTNLNLIITPGTAGVTIDAFAGLIPTQLEQIGATGVEVTIVDGPFGDAARAEFDLAVVGESGDTVNAHLLQFAALDSLTTYVLTFTTTESSFDALETTFETVFSTLQPIDG
jgi:hypothetical protein